MFRSLTAAAFVCAAQPALAVISPEEGFYGSAGVGWNNVDDISYSVVEAPGASAGYDVEQSFSAMIAVGYDYPGGTRTELELSFRDSEADSAGAFNAVGKVATTALMGNIFYDFGSRTSKLAPFIGAGVGISYLDHQLTSRNAGGLALQIDDTESALAWQGVGGLSYRFNDRVSMDLSYRYFDTEKVQYSSTAPGGALETDYESHDVMLAFRWIFIRPAESARDLDEF